ncbi:MAG: lipocalin-like domain-containing protein [Gammaproteobacteria bacterium]|jgi:hypothetical protein
MRWIFAGATLIAVAGLNTAQAQSGLSNEQALSRLAGVWTLVDWDETLADGTTRKHGVTDGRIIYSEIGEMCAVVMDPDRAQWKSAGAPSPAEALAGTDSRVFYAYCARAEMHADEGFALHHTTIDKIPNNVGAVRKRWFRFLGPDRIELRIDEAELRDPVVRSELIWERVVD